MKRCPTCNRTFTDPNLIFCIDDGTPLSTVIAPSDETTAVSPSSSQSGNNTGDAYTPRDWQEPEYRPPGAYVPPGGASKRRIWPWVLGALALVIVGITALGIVAAIVIPRMVRSSNSNRGGYSTGQRSENRNLNLNSNSNTSEEITNSNTAANANTSENGDTPPPTEQQEVLSVLTDLEHDWTAANINADKKALDRILADDYVSAGPQGGTIGKAEYISTIQRDRQTQRWEFFDLKVELTGNRATLSGVIRYYTAQGDTDWRFTDKFVWRDGRWQATGSDVEQVPKTTL